ncbi:MAG: BolA protein [Bradymonadia bacterium]|jgi:BolA protein
MVADEIQAALTAGINCAHLQVLNESHMHSVPANSETHFRVIVVSDDFEGANRVKRHRLINKLLAPQLQGPVHALAIEAVTPVQWEANGGAKITAPKCLGGSKAEA